MKVFADFATKSDFLQRNCFNNPVNMGDTEVVTCNGRTYQVSLVDSIRGDKANQLVKGNVLSVDPDPGPGYEYWFRCKNPF